MPKAHTFPPIEELLPHRAGMLMLDRVTAFDGVSAVAEYAPRSDAWYADAQGHMPAWIGIELMAQAVAAHVGLTKRLQGRPPQMGALLGTRSYRAALPRFPGGETLQVRAAMVYRDPSGLGAYDCSIDGSLGGPAVPLATATLKVFEPDDFAAFVNGSTP